MSDTQRIRLLHVIQNLHYGGMERLLSDLMHRFDPTRFELHVLVLGFFGRFGEGLAEVATLHQAPPLEKWSLLWPRRLAASIRSIAPDVVHTHSGVWYKVALAARAAGVPFLVHTDHGRPTHDPWLARFLHGRAARRTDVVIAVSDALRQRLEATVVPRGTRIVVVRNGVDTEHFVPGRSDGIRAALGISGEAMVLGSIGRLEAIKGYEVAVEAMAHLREKVPDPVALVLAGDGSERSRLEAMAESLGVAGSVHFLGWRDDVHELLATFDIFTMSSHSEGTSVSLLEAMSTGLCPVVTDVGGNRAVLGPELAHRLVPPADPAALAAAWSEAIQDVAARARDGAAARERVITEFSLDAMVRAYEGVYSRGAYIVPEAPVGSRVG